MANASIKAAFERMWQHTVLALGEKFNKTDIIPIENGGIGNSWGLVQSGALDGSTIGTKATAEGQNTTASGDYSHAEGDRTTASGDYSHAEGKGTEASGSYSHAEGFSTDALGYASHAEGINTIASGDYSHAEGGGEIGQASGSFSHSEGNNTVASGTCSHTEGYQTRASSDYQHAQGKYNIEDTTDTYAHIVGNGTSDSARSNAHTLDWNGNAWFAGNIFIGGTSQEDADQLTTSKLGSTAAGSATQPVYFTNGVPTACTYTLGKSVPSNAVFTDTNTTYSAGTGISLSGTTFSNSGVRSIATGSSNGTISVNTNGTSANVAVKGLAAAAYKGVTDSTAAGAIGTGSNLVTERDVYYGLPKINNSNSYTRSTTIYAPTAGGTSGYVLVGAGTTTAPTWKSLSNAGIAAKSHTHSYLPLSGGTLTGDLTIGGGFLSLGNNANEDITVLHTDFDTSHTLAIGYGSFEHNHDTEIFGGGYGYNGGIKLIIPNYSAAEDEDGVALWSSNSDVSCYFRPLNSGDCGLGSTSYRWYRLWAANSCNTSSDEREKSDIMSMSDYPATWSRDGSGNVFEKLFNKLIPKTYTLNIEQSDEIHMGFIAQDVAAAFEELGLSEDDLGFISHDYWTDEKSGEEKDRYGLAYEEFIALNTYMIQKQQAKIEAQEFIIEEQQTEINDLKERITKLEELFLNK